MNLYSQIFYNVLITNIDLYRKYIRKVRLTMESNMNDNKRMEIKKIDVLNFGEDPDILK